MTHLPATFSRNSFCIAGSIPDGLRPQHIALVKMLDETKTLRVTVTYAGRDSAVGTATRFGPVIESRWGRDFPHLTTPALGPTQPPIQWLPGIPGDKAAAA